MTIPEEPPETELPENPDVEGDPPGDPEPDDAPEIDR
jgi:hypothetical protein